MLLFLGLFCIFLLIVAHEYGHFLVAKRNGVEAEEFGIGFPPKVYGKTMGKGIFRTHYSINLLPIGGFVKLKGETDSDTRKGSFGAASLWVKVKVMMAGVVMNWIAAAFIFTVLAIVGMPVVLPNQFTVESDTIISSIEVLAAGVNSESPAEIAGIEIGDKILSIDGETITTSDELIAQTEANAGDTVDLTFSHRGKIQTVEVTLNSNNTDQGYLGVQLAESSLRKSTWSALVVGVGVTGQFSWETFKGIGGIIVNLGSGNVGEAGESVTGVLGILFIFSNASNLGGEYVFLLVGVISISLAVMNSLPIPALDGGRLFVTILFKAMKKPLNESIEQKIHGGGMVFLLSLMVLVTVLDIKRLF